MFFGVDLRIFKDNPETLRSLKSAATEQELLDVLQRPRFAPKIAPVSLDGVRRMLAAAE